MTYDPQVINEEPGPNLMISNIFVEPITENIRGNHTVLAEVRQCIIFKQSYAKRIWQNTGTWRIRSSVRELYVTVINYIMTCMYLNKQLAWCSQSGATSKAHFILRLSDLVNSPLSPLCCVEKQSEISTGRYRHRHRIVLHRHNCAWTNCWGSQISNQSSECPPGLSLCMADFCSNVIQILNYIHIRSYESAMAPHVLVYAWLQW